MQDRDPAAPVALVAGASGIVKHFVDAGVDCVILSNSEDGTWPILHKLDDLLLA